MIWKGKRNVSSNGNLETVQAYDVKGSSCSCKKENNETPK
jgi:hypothetical protein